MRLLYGVSYFLVQLVPVCGAGVSRYSGIQLYIIVIVLGEKYGAEWGKGISIPTTCRIWDLDVDEPIVPFSRVDRCVFMDCLVEQVGYRKCHEGRSKVL